LLTSDVDHIPAKICEDPQSLLPKNLVEALVEVARNKLDRHKLGKFNTLNSVLIGHMF
jgi:hypothetical protein